MDWDLWAYKRFSVAESRQLVSSAPWLHFTDIGPIEVGRSTTIESAGTKPGRYRSSPVVAIDRVVPARELSATELETVRFVGAYINLRGHSPRRTDR